MVDPGVRPVPVVVVTMKHRHHPIARTDGDQWAPRLAFGLGISYPPSGKKSVNNSAPRTSRAGNYVLLAQDARATKPTSDVFRYLPDVPHSRLVDAAIPTDPALWEPAQFRDFIKERRRLLAAQMNEALKVLAGNPPIDSGVTPESAILEWNIARHDEPNA